LAQGAPMSLINQMQSCWACPISSASQLSVSYTVAAMWTLLATSALFAT
jgi:hypothetical protein